MYIEDRNACIIYRNTITGFFIRRINRFTAEVYVSGKRMVAHVKNTGRLRELLIPGADVILQDCRSENRKTVYDLISVYKQGIGWINIDSLAPNALMKQYFCSLDYDLVKPEYTFGNSRFDFYMEKNGQRFLTEVKGCTLAFDVINGIGKFPDAPTERGIKHLNELKEASGSGCHCSISFVIQMNGFRLVDPNDETQPEFRKALIEAVHSGVHVLCYGSKVEADRIILTEEMDDTERYLGG